MERKKLISSSTRRKKRLFCHSFPPDCLHALFVMRSALANLRIEVLFEARPNSDAHRRANDRAPSKLIRVW